MSVAPSWLVPVAVSIEAIVGLVGDIVRSGGDLPKELRRARAGWRAQLATDKREAIERYYGPEVP